MKPKIVYKSYTPKGRLSDPLGNKKTCLGNLGRLPVALVAGGGLFAGIHLGVLLGVVVDRMAIDRMNGYRSNGSTNASTRGRET